MPSQNNSRSRKSDGLEELALGGKMPPQAPDVEEAVLGAMLNDPSCVETAMEDLSDGSFLDKRNKMIFAAVCKLVEEHVGVNIISVSTKLKEMGNLEAVGGSVVLARMSEKIGSSAHMEYFVKVLKQKNIQRDLITASNAILKDAYDDQVNMEDLVDMAQSRVYEAVQKNIRHDVQDIGSVINKAMNRIQEMQTIEGMSGVPSGYPSIDRITNGWQKSDLIILAARPSVGKTAFSLNIIRNAAVDHHIPVAFFSLEMSSIQLGMRLMTSESGLSADKIKGGIKLENDEWTLLEQSLKNLAKAPIYIDETPGLPLMEFRTKVKSLVKQKGVRLVVVDYLQLMQGPADYKGNREQEVAAISRMLKATAKELEIPIIALSQLSRASVQRQSGNGKPQLSDLRESGSIEQDADMVIFIHRPDFVGLSDDSADKEKTQIIIAKHRNGETKDIDMVFKSERVRFMEVSDTLYNDQRTYESAMNSASYEPSQEFNPYDN